MGAVTHRPSQSIDGRAGRARAARIRARSARRSRPARSSSDFAAAGDLLRALAAPVRIAIVLELRGAPCCVHDLVDALAVPNPWSASTCGCSRRRASCTASGRGREVVYSLVDDHLAHIVVDAVAHAEEAVVTTARAMRATRQRAAVSGLLDRLADFRSAQEIHEELRRVGEGIGLTTVYRTLQALADAGEVDVLRTGSGRVRLPAVRHAPTTTTISCAGGAARPWRSPGPRWRRGRSGSPTSTATPT